MHSNLFPSRADVICPSPKRSAGRALPFHVIREPQACITFVGSAHRVHLDLRTKA